MYISSLPRQSPNFFLSGVFPNRPFDPNLVGQNQWKGRKALKKIAPGVGCASDPESSPNTYDDSIRTFPGTFL